MRLKQFFNTDMIKAVREYHLAQRDKHVMPIRWVCDPEGYPLLLVRFEDEDGKRISALMSCDAPCGPDDPWVVDEVAHTARENEHDMLQGEMAASRFGDDTACEWDEEQEDEHKYLGDD